MGGGADTTWTIRRTLTWMSADFEQRGIATARLDAELLLALALECNRVALYIDLDRPMSGAELERVRGLVVRRRRREPVAYITGRKEFYGRAFEVTPAVLIPRPDTEILVEKALEMADKEGASRILDLCTGSGAIAVTLAAERPSLRVDAADISADALHVAMSNARNNGVEDRVRFFLGDLFHACPFGCQGESASGGLKGAYDMILCNPPYISAAQWGQLAPEIVDFEPALALRGGEEGLDFYPRICAGADRWLAPEGSLLLEIGHDQADAVVEVLRSEGGFGAVAVHRDLGGRWRVVTAKSRQPRERKLVQATTV